MKLSPSFEDALLNLPVSQVNVRHAKESIAALNRLLKKNPGTKDAGQISPALSHFIDTWKMKSKAAHTMRHALTQ